MNDKEVTDLAGIGEVLGKRLESKGFDKVWKESICWQLNSRQDLVYSTLGRFTGNAKLNNVIGLANQMIMFAQIILNPAECVFFSEYECFKLNLAKFILSTARNVTTFKFGIKVPACE